jgi:hypothetical protein
MFLVQCNGCKTAAVTEHARDPDTSIVCPPESDCCKADHHHGETANACPGGHGACPTPAACPVWGQRQPEGPCPGGHCGLGIAGCSVCRPITITALPGTTGINAGTGA